MILGMYEKSDGIEQDCINLIAKLPHIVATVINHHAGWGKTPNPNTELGYMENFTKMVNVPGKNESQLLDIFKLFNVLHFDHGGGNLSCFTGKTVASGGRHLYGSISAAMNSLAGPLHGKANQDGLKFIQEIDAAAVYWNASTRFTDGSQFGLGAEIGISTQKLHARGPMSVQHLTTKKYFILGRGHIRK